MTFTRQANTGYQSYLPEANNVIDYCFRLKLDYPRLLFQGGKNPLFITPPRELGDRYKENILF